MRLFVLALVLGQFSFGFRAIATPQVSIDLQAEARKEEEFILDIIGQVQITRWGIFKNMKVIESLSNPKVRDAVIKELFSDKKISQNYMYAIISIGESKPEYILPALIECYNKGDSKVCNSLMLVNVGYGYPSQILPLLIESAKSHPSAEVREQTIRSLKDLRGYNSGNEIIDKLTPEQQQQITEVYLDRLQKDPSWQVQHEAADGFMWESTRQDGFVILQKELQTQKDFRVVTQIIKTLKKYKGPSDDAFNAQHFEKIKKMVLDANLAEDDRHGAISNLRELGVTLGREKEALPVLIQACEESRSDEIYFRVLHDISAYTDYLKREEPVKRNEYMKKLRGFVNQLDDKARQYFLERINNMEKRVNA